MFRIGFHMHGKMPKIVQQYKNMPFLFISPTDSQKTGQKFKGKRKRLEI